MHSPCPHDLEAFWQHAAEPDAALAQHLGQCSGCGARAAHARALVRTLQGLETQRAPRELEGAVVAALNAGARQERAVASLRALERASVPGELEERVETLALWPEELSAPVELDQRLDQELRAPTQAMSQRFLAKLDRLRAPPVLETRVAAGSAEGRRRALAIVGGLLLLIALGSLTVQRWSADQIEAPQQRVAIRWQVETVESAEDLDPIARALIGGLSGGASEIVGKERL